MPLKCAVTHLKMSAVVALAVSALMACSDTTVATRSFEESREFQIPGGPLNFGIVELPTIPIEINLADQPGYSDGDFDFVTSVRVRELEFEITPESNVPANALDQEDGNLDSFEFVSSLRLALREAGTAGDGVLVADLPINDPQIASNTTALSMNVRDTDIRDIIEAQNGAELLVTIAGSVPPDFVQVKANMRFRVGIGFR